MKNTLLVSWFLLTATAQAAGLPASVAKAHEAYLRCDGSAILTHVKSALEETKNHPMIVTNTMGVMGAAAKNGCLGNAQPDFTFPAEVTYVEIEVARKYRTENGKVTFGINASLGVKKGIELEQFQVIRYPDQVILDKQANIGDLYVEPEEDETGYWIGGEQNVKPVEEGLYLVNVKLKDQTMIKAYVLLNDLNASASPVILSPVTDQVFSDSQPKFSWKPYHSPEADGQERVRLNVSVRRQEDDGDDLMWVRLKDSKATSFKVGDKEAARNYQGKSELDPDKLYMQVSYKEIKQFGFIGIRRASTTRVPFTVK